MVMVTSVVMMPVVAVMGLLEILIAAVDASHWDNLLMIVVFFSLVSATETHLARCVWEICGGRIVLNEQNMRCMRRAICRRVDLDEIEAGEDLLGERGISDEREAVPP